MKKHIDKKTEELILTEMRKLLRFPDIDKTACLIIAGFLGIASLLLFALAFLGAPYYGDSWFLSFYALSKPVMFWSIFAFSLHPVRTIIFWIYTYYTKEKIKRLILGDKK